MAHQATLPEAERRIGQSMSIVWDEDFFIAARLCLDYVEITGVPLHILSSDDGRHSAQLSQIVWHRAYPPDLIPKKRKSP